jgi:hypothetical protein
MSIGEHAVICRLDIVIRKLDQVLELLKLLAEAQYNDSEKERDDGDSEHE